jgi:S-adenosylmethionine-diacylglycerol 3-amino-3-carboxypropyl transferase
MPESTVSRLKRAVHRHPRVSREGLLERLFTLWFRGFVYTQIWEDPRVDAEALQLDASSRVLTISSAGCNVLNYLVHQPKRIVAVDLNQAHMALTRLKLAALRHLPDHDAFFRFFGAADDPANVDAYHTHLRPHLDAETRSFWERRTWGGLGRPRIQYFANGLYEQGVLPRFQRFAARVANLVMGRRPEELLEAESLAEQRQFFEACVAPFFDHAFVRWLGGMPATVYSLGIPPSQQRIMAEESGTSVVDLYRDRLETLVCDFPLDDNYFAWQAFGRCYDCENRAALPPYLDADHFGRLRYHADAVETHVTSLADHLRAQPDSSFDSFVLLDAMDWMDPGTITDLWRGIARVGAPGARIIFRTAGTPSVVEPALPDGLRRRFRYEEERSRELHAQDRSAIYGGFHLYVLAD